jgi:hypothetical protein
MPKIKSPDARGWTGIRGVMDGWAERIVLEATSK